MVAVSVRNWAHVNSAPLSIFALSFSRRAVKAKAAATRNEAVAMAFSRVLDSFISKKSGFRYKPHLSLLKDAFGALKSGLLRP